MSDQHAEPERRHEITIGAFRVGPSGSTEIVPPETTRASTRDVPSTMRWPDCRCPRCKRAS